jgi:ADP-ribose pyrophosphatase YjhB (NUDIX family)
MSIYVDKYEKYKCKYLELKKQIGGVPSNACIALISTYGGGEPGIYMVKGQSNWNIPGGNIEQTDASPLDAALREFKEETGGHSIDNLRSRLSQNQYIRHGHTVIFYYVINKSFNITFIPNNEKTAGSWIKISRVKNKSLKMRKCFRKSVIGALAQAGF